jgi:hypothetical protein
VGERSAVIIIKNEGFAALVLDASVGYAVHGSWLGGRHSALPLLGSRLAKVSVSFVVIINSKIAESITEVVVIIGLVISVAIALGV